MHHHHQLVGHWAPWQARLFQTAFPLVSLLLGNASPRLQFGTKEIADPSTVAIPTRHGIVSALVYAPTAEDIARQLEAGLRPPVHLITHGGAFVIRVPEQEDNVARYLASEVGCYVVIPDYSVAPAVRFPVAEQQCYDAYRWIHENGEYGWDPDRISVGGPSAGGKLALNVALMAIDDGYPSPRAVSVEYGVVDLTMPDEARTSLKKNPIVGPRLMRLVRETYFAGAPLDTPLASPPLHPRRAELPPTLILTGGLDTLKHEANALARDLADRGVSVTHREFPGVDHGFTHAKPIAVAREAIELIGRHLTTAYSEPPTRRHRGSR